MLVRMMIIALAFVTSTSCTVKRQVLEGNVFRSETSPTLTMKVNPSFQYIGHIKNSLFDYGAPGESAHRIAPMRVESYFFVQTGRNNIIKRFIAIQIQRITENNWYFMGGEFADWENKLDEGRIQLGGKEYRYGVQFASIGGEIADFFTSKSFFLTEVYTLKLFSRIPSRGCLLHIWYAEDGTEFLSHFDKSASDSDGKLKDFLNAFHQGCEQSFMISE